MIKFKAKILDIHCKHCIDAVHQAIKSVKSVRKVHVYLDGLALITLDDSQSLGKIGYAVELAGYEVKYFMRLG